jgi:uncharacterized membrane protein
MIGVCVGLVGICLVYYLAPTEPLQFLVSVPLLFFLPGYVLVGVLFPRTGQRPNHSQPGDSRSLATARDLSRVTLTERAALSFGLSVALVPFFGFLLELLPIEAFDGATFPTLVVFVLVGALVASVRRLRTPRNERFSLPLKSAIGTVSSPFAGPMPRAERIATIALAASVLLAIVSVGYVFAVPQQGEQFTDFRVMTESPDGELTLGNYPDEITVDNGTELVVGITNQEGQRQAYTVVVTAEQIINDSGSLSVIETTEVDRFETTPANGERVQHPRTLTLDTAGEFRINYYLYVNEPPTEPDADSAYRHAHLTVTAANEPPVGNVSETDATDNTGPTGNASETDTTEGSEPTGNESENDPEPA